MFQLCWNCKDLIFWAIWTLVVNILSWPIVPALIHCVLSLKSRHLVLGDYRTRCCFLGCPGLLRILFLGFCLLPGFSDCCLFYWFSWLMCSWGPACTVGGWGNLRFRGDDLRDFQEWWNTGERERFSWYSVAMLGLTMSFEYVVTTCRKGLWGISGLLASFTDCWEGGVFFWLEAGFIFCRFFGCL